MLAYHKEEESYYAVKIINKSQYRNQYQRLVEEIDILSSVNHPHIIHLKEIFEMDGTLYIITQLASGGDLFDRIIEKGKYTEIEAATLISYLLHALSYLHSKNIIHRDLKPENLLLRSADSDVDILIADFGLSKLLDLDNMVAMSTCGTPIYIAPEIISQPPPPSSHINNNNNDVAETYGGYTTSVDLWSVGVITYILLSGKPPFFHRNLGFLFSSIKDADFDYPIEDWQSISDEAISFIDSLLVPSPSLRPTALQSLNHPWIRKFASPSSPPSS